MTNDANQETTNFAQQDTASTQQDEAQNSDNKSEIISGNNIDKIEESTQAQIEKSGQVKAPEKYELKTDNNTLLNNDQIKEIEAYARQQGFSNDQAQDLLNREQKLLSNYKESLHFEFEEKAKEWVNSIKSDKEIGGENFTKNMETAKRVLDRFSTDEFKKTLNESGFGNHPELVRIFVKIGNAMSEDTFISTKSGVQAKKSIEEIFYGSNQ